MRIDVEWSAAPGVRDPVLERTWCHLEIEASGRFPTRFHSFTSESVRHGVYGSAFPLCRWIVTHWWHLLFEAMPSEALTRGTRSAIAAARLRPWLERHSLLFARDGSPLPDLLLFRDEKDLHASWTEDPPAGEPGSRGRFIDSGTARIPLEDARRALHTFVESVLDRLDGLDIAEVEDLRQDWHATCAAIDNDDGTLQTIAAVGLDPFDIDDPSFEELAGLAERIRRLAPETAGDLLEAGSVRTIASDVAYVESGVEVCGTGLGPSKHEAFRVDTRTRPPHEVGYRWARALRSELHLDPEEPVDSVEGLIEDLFPKPQIQWAARETPGNVDAVIGSNGHGLAVYAVERSEPAKRFLLARALARALGTEVESGARLISRCADWGQRLGRAFAAELLAPSAALMRHLEEAEDDDAISRLAEEFNVAHKLVHHQLINHGLSYGSAALD